LPVPVQAFGEDDFGDDFHACSSNTHTQPQTHTTYHTGMPHTLRHY
jgi:hypothetical protein